MRSSLIAIAATACGGAPPTVQTPPPPSQEVAIPSPVHAEFTVVPAELADDGVLARIPHRTRIRRFGDAWLRETGQRSTHNSDRADSDVVLPVIGESPTKIRVAFHDDSARLALWIARRDTWTVVGAPIQLADREHHVQPDVGVWLVTGAPVSLAEPDGKRAWHDVTLPDTALTITGTIPDRAITNVWIAERDDGVSLDPGHATSWMPKSDRRPKVKLADNTPIYAAASADASVIASTVSPDVSGIVIGPRGDFTRIEIRRPYATIRGYIAAAQLTDTSDDFGTLGTGSGHGFGMSHADRIDVKAGTCLYDRVDGEVVGVQSEDSTRLGSAKWATGWAKIHVGTSWMVAELFVKDLGTDPTQPVWEPCTQPVHR